MSQPSRTRSWPWCSVRGRPLRRARAWLALRALTFALVGSLPWVTACSTVNRQLQITSVNGCIKRECSAEQGAARQQCTTACMQHYGSK
jgi:hypothetical protein